MRDEGRIGGSGSDMSFKSSTDNRGYPATDMAHFIDAGACP
ncbi:hypothetical protein ACQ86O_21835 [Serratia sp. L9]